MSPTSTPTQAQDWPARQREWQRRLPRLRLLAEPVEDQLRRLRRATIGLSIVTGGIALLFLALFSTFGSPAIGLLIGGLLAGAVVTPAWRSYRRTRIGAEHYLREQREAQARSDRPRTA